MKSKETITSNPLLRLNWQKLLLKTGSLKKLLFQSHFKLKLAIILEKIITLDRKPKESVTSKLFLSKKQKSLL